MKKNNKLNQYTEIRFFLSQSQNILMFVFDANPFCNCVSLLSNAFLNSALLPWICNLLKSLCYEQSEQLTECELYELAIHDAIVIRYSNMANCNYLLASINSLKTEEFGEWMQLAWVLMLRMPRQNKYSSLFTFNKDSVWSCLFRWKIDRIMIRMRVSMADWNLPHV